MLERGAAKGSIFLKFLKQKKEYLMDILTKLVIRILKGADFTHEFASIFLVILEIENFKNSLRCPRITQTKYYDFF
jgi:hypothetical protein